jgi:hypothetical protein
VPHISRTAVFKGKVKRDRNQLQPVRTITTSHFAFRFRPVMVDSGWSSSTKPAQPAAKEVVSRQQALLRQPGYTSTERKSFQRRRLRGSYDGISKRRRRIVINLHGSGSINFPWPNFREGEHFGRRNLLGNLYFISLGYLTRREYQTGALPLLMAVAASRNSGA